MKTKNEKKLLRRAYIMTLLSFAFLISVSFAWYYSKVSIGGGGLATGNISFTAYGYNEEGTLVSTLKPGEGVNQETKVNVPIFSRSEWKPKDASTAFISIVNTGSIDIEFNVSFSAKGQNDEEENYIYLGGFWYKLTEITSEMAYANDDELKTYASQNKVILCNETNCQNRIHTCTENNGLGNYQNMNNIIKTTTQGVIKTNDTIQKRYYRLDYGVRSEATPIEYADKQIELLANIYVTQVGAIEHPEGIGIEYIISDVATLENALTNSVPGDTLVFANSVTYTGNIVINKALNMNLNGNTFTVYGDLTYNFTAAHTMKINLAGSGTIKVLSSGANGGTLLINTPNAQVELMGNNKYGDLFVERTCTISATNNEEKSGFVFNGATVLDTYNQSKEIYLLSNTKVVLNDGSFVKRFEARAEATNIQIINDGEIGTINLASMFPSDLIERPQIDIYNTGVITNVVLPTWSTPFKEQNGTYSGNTKIINGFGSIFSSLVESSGFKYDDVVFETADTFVFSLDGTEHALRIYYRNKGATVTTIEGLLQEYFVSLGYTSSVAKNRIARITHLEIDAISGKALTEEDITYINSKNLASLEILDLEDVSVPNNTITAYFYTQITIKQIKLPKNIEVIQRNAFGADVYLEYLEIPASIKSIEKRALANVRYTRFLGYSVPTTEKDSLGSVLDTKFVFANEESTETFEIGLNKYPEYDRPGASNYNYNTIPYPVYSFNSILADDGINFVTKKDDGTYRIDLLDLEKRPELCDGDSYIVGEGLTINGEPIVVTEVGRHAFSNRDMKSLKLKLCDTITTLGIKAFANTTVDSFDLNAVSKFGPLACMNLTANYVVFSKGTTLAGYRVFTYADIGYLDLGTVDRIEQDETNSAFFYRQEGDIVDLKNVTYLVGYAFQNSAGIKKVIGNKVTFIGSNAFNGCTNLYEAYFLSVKDVKANAFNGCTKLKLLEFGTSLTTIESNSLYNTPELDYLYIPANKRYTLGRLGDSNIIDRVYVHSSQYANYVSAYSKHTDSYREYGDRYEDYYITIEHSSSEPYKINIGKYNVKASRADNAKAVYAWITSYNVLPEDYPEEYTIPSSAYVNFVDATTGEPRYESKPVVRATKRAYFGCQANIVNFSSVTQIFDYAFYNCDNIQVLNAPKLKLAAQYAFAECDSLTSLILPVFFSFRAYSFANCKNLESIFVGTAADAFDENNKDTAFSGCTNIKNITIDLTTINTYLPVPFSTIANTNIDLVVPSSAVETFKADATFGKFNVTGYDAKAVQSKSNEYYLKEVTIGSTAGYEIIAIKKLSNDLIIPNSVNSKPIISSKKGVFDNLYLDYLTLPKDYMDVKEQEFSKLKGIKEFKAASGCVNYSVASGVLYSKDGSVLIAYPNGKTDESFDITSTTYAIDSYSFANNPYLKSLNIDASVKVIGNNAFTNSNILTYTFKGTTVPYLSGSNVFKANDINIVIYVPSTAVTAYKASTSFALYVDYIKSK